MKYEVYESWVKCKQSGDLKQAATIIFDELEFNYTRALEKGFPSSDLADLVERVYFAIAHKRSFISNYPEKLPALIEELKSTRKKMIELMKTI